MTKERRPLLLMVNPVSGRKPGSPASLADEPEAQKPEALAEAFRSRGLTVRLHILSKDDDPAEIARAAAAEEDVVVAGGDGTVGPVAGVLASGEAALGILPMGSWNNVARGLGIATELDPALETIARGEIGLMDVGLAWHPSAEQDEPTDNAQTFFEAAGVGLDAAGFGVAQLGDRAGWWPAIRAMWRALRKRRTGMILEVDGERFHTHAPAVTVCNGPYHGLGFALVPDADPTDGLLHIAVFSGMSQLDVIRHFLAVARGRERHEPRLKVLTGRRVTIRGSRRVLPAHADGHVIGVTPVTFEVQPGRLRVFR